MVSVAAADDAAPHFAFEWYPPEPVSPGTIAIDPEGSIWYLEVPGGAIHRTRRDGNPLYSYGHAVDLTCGEQRGAWTLENNSLQYRHADAIVICDTPFYYGVHIAANAAGVMFATQTNYGSPPRPHVVSVSDVVNEPYPCVMQSLFDLEFEPGDITVGQDGTLFMVDLDHNRIVHWDATGDQLDSWSLPGGSTLAVLATDPDGNVLVGQGHTVYKYDAMGTLLMHWGDASTFSSISGIAVNALGDVYVSDSGLNRIRMYGTRQPGDNPPVPPTPPGPPPPPPPPLTDHPAAILLHVVPATAHTTCDGPSSLDSVITFQNLGPNGAEHSVVYMIASPNATTQEICGVQAGIAYDATRDGHAGVEMQAWHLCADMEFPDDNWPASGTGNTVTWANQAYATDVNVMGYFEVFVHGASTMSVTPWPISGVAKIANCSSLEYTLVIPPDRLGWVSWGGAGFGLDTNGCNPAREPCVTASVPTQAVTWGRLKNLYGH